ncbi:MAG: hydroxymethylbilane synthase [Desulfomonile tiedjei]|uniref:Porphobilinogen deaminase n=1 Tax=Desulfomonile tiedjei TaxID=2358 RepID=A0A9D6Z3D2_9BACT|nr:hydroxymethylbilane synthase [Desulfomonile tiedjei]
MTKLRIGTRGSALALWQARHVASIIEARDPEMKVELEIIKTQGDKILDAPLAKIGGKGLFTKEIEDALLEGKVDLAVHSMKDVPTDIPDGLRISAIMKREDPRDVFISGDGLRLEQLLPGSRIGTSSLRRKAFLLNRFPDLEIISIRGNVDTRLRKIESENLAGVMLAAAGILRMGYADRITSFMEPDLVIPAIGQGALAIETRVGDRLLDSVVEPLNHPDTELCVRIERAFLQRLGGGCQVPMAAHCVRNGKDVDVTAAVVHPDGNPMIRETFHGPAENSGIGSRLADVLIGRGADSILKSVLSDDWEPGPAMDII